MRLQMRHVFLGCLAAAVATAGFADPAGAALPAPEPGADGWVGRVSSVLTHTQENLQFTQTVSIVTGQPAQAHVQFDQTSTSDCYLSTVTWSGDLEARLTTAISTYDGVSTLTTYGSSVGTVPGERYTEYPCTGFDGSTSHFDSGFYPIPFVSPCVGGEVQPNTQAFNANITCFSDSGGVVYSEVISVRLRRADCDQTVDSDGDSLSDCLEYELNLNPLNSDTDGGGVDDGEEVRRGTDGGDKSDDGPDTDGDGVLDTVDECPGTPVGVPVDTVGCPENQPPVAVPDTATTRSGIPVSVPVAANDTDPDGDAVSLVSCTQPDASHGSVTVTGGVTFTPTPGFRGQTSFTCTVQDPYGASTTAPVTITVVAGELTVHANIGYVAFWYNAVPNFSFTGRPGSDYVSIRGSTSAWVTGHPDVLALVKQVCITPSWQARVNRNEVTVPVDWSEGGRDLMGTSDDFWQTPPRSLPGNMGSEVIAKLPACTAGTTGGWAPAGALVAQTNQAGRTVNLVRIAHSANVTVVLHDGTVLPLNIKETERAASRPPTIEDLDERQSKTFEL